MPEIVDNENDSSEEIESSSKCGAPNNFGSFNGRPASSTGKIQMKYCHTRAITKVRKSQKEILVSSHSKIRNKKKN